MNTITHTAADFEDEDQCSLHDDCVHVALERDEHPIETDMPGVFRVIIHPDDRPCTFEKSVCRALEAKGFETILDGHGGNGILVAQKGFRKFEGFKQIKAI